MCSFLQGAVNAPKLSPMLGTATQQPRPSATFRTPELCHEDSFKIRDLRWSPQVFVVKVPLSFRLRCRRWKEATNLREAGDVCDWRRALAADRLVPDVAAAGDLVTDATPRAFRRTRRQTTKQLHCKQILQEGEGDNVDPSVGAM